MKSKTWHAGIDALGNTAENAAWESLTVKEHLREFGSGNYAQSTPETNPMFPVLLILISLVMVGAPLLLIL